MASRRADRGGVALRAVCAHGATGEPVPAQGFDKRTFGRTVKLAVVAALAAGGPFAGQWAQAQDKAPRANIFSCDVNGKKITSDRPIAECADRDQRLLNGDGSVRQVVPKTPTPDEQADMDRRKAQEAAEQAALRDAIRRDQNLVLKYPNEARHRTAREGALDDIRKSVKKSEARIALLEKERKPLMDEAEFYPPPKTLPPKLRNSIDANDAALEAQRALVQNQQAEVGRINALYDAELDRLRKLWSGARAGSLGPMPPQATASAPAALPPASKPLLRASR